MANLLFCFILLLLAPSCRTTLMIALVHRAHCKLWQVWLCVMDHVWWLEQEIYIAMPTMIGGKPGYATVLIDSGCSKSIFCNTKLLINLRKASRQTVRGINGNVSVALQGDYPFMVTDTKGETHETIIYGCFVAEECEANLLSVSDLTDAGIKVSMTKEGSYLGWVGTDNKYHKAFFAKVGRLFPTGAPAMTYTAYLGKTANEKIYALSDAELWHLRLGHAHIDKIAKLSRNCKGIKRPINSSARSCHTCQDTKIERRNALPASSSNKTGVWNWDLLDMGDS